MIKTVEPISELPHPDEPPPYFVIYLNDDITPSTFVIESLIKYFDYSVVEAVDMAHKIDTLGMYVVATLPHCIAEQLAFDVQRDAVTQGYPLRVVIEPEY